MNNHFKFVVAGNSHLAESFADGLIDAGLKCLGAISLCPKLRPTNSPGLSSWASQAFVEYYEVENINSPEFIGLAGAIRSDFLVVEWPELLQTQTIDLFPMGAIGSHPSQIPWGRGRHPLHWQIVMGYSETTISFFRLSSKIDAGPLLLQLPISIRDNETVLTLLEKVRQFTFRGGQEIGAKLVENGSFVEIPQETSRGSVWRKRNLEDVEIDCRMTRNSISRLVRSVVPPYLGAKLVTDVGSFIVTKADPTDFTDWEFQQIGSLLEINKDSIVIRVDDGPIRLFLDGGDVESLRGCSFVMPPSFYKNLRQTSNQVRD
jgi:methionyl-tRNA formyltransferase